MAEKITETSGSQDRLFYFIFVLRHIIKRAEIPKWAFL